jgi:hypothetical protein
MNFMPLLFGVKSVSPELLVVMDAVQFKRLAATA